MTWLALLFSLICPGAGQIFRGQFLLGILFGLLFCLGKSALLPLSLRVCKVTKLRQTLQFFYVCNWGYIVLILGAALAVFFYTPSDEKKYFLETFLFILCVRLIYKQTFNPLIFTALCGRSGMWKIWQSVQKSPTRK